MEVSLEKYESFIQFSGNVLRMGLVSVYSTFRSFNGLGHQIIDILEADERKDSL